MFRLWFHLQGMSFCICPNFKTQTTFGPKHFQRGMLIIAELVCSPTWLTVAEWHGRHFSWTRMKLSSVSATSNPSPWALSLNHSAWHTPSVLFLLKYTTFSLQILKKHEVPGTVLGVRGIERRTAKSPTAGSGWSVGRW